MPIKLNGATSGSIELDVPAAVGSDLQLTLPATAGDVVVKAADGSVDLGSVDIDSSGRLLVGTSTSPSVANGQYARIVVQGYTGDATGAGDFSIQRGEAAAAIINDEDIGWIRFNDSAGYTFAHIGCLADANAGSGDYPGRLVFSTTANGASSPTERMKISENGNLNVPAVYSFTGPVSANVGVDSDGLLFRATSSIKYKKDVETLADSYADAILSCRPVWYRAKEAPSTLSSDWGYWGFIAEEVAEIDPRLVQWKTTEIVQSDDGSLGSVACEPTPDGVQYDRFVPHLLNLIKRQQQAIETLETKVAALEAAS